MARSETFKGNAIFLGVCLAVVLAAVIVIILNRESDEPPRASSSISSASTEPKPTTVAEKEKPPAQRAPQCAAKHLPDHLTRAGVEEFVSCA